MSFIIQPAAGGATITATASGAIAANKPCVVNANGTVSEVGLSLISGYTISSSQGATTQMASNTTSAWQSICYDVTNQKLVGVVIDATTNYLNVYVGALSGNNVTWGTAVVPESIAVYYPDLVYDAASGKVVLFGFSPSFGKICYVGTVSGSSISFGSRVVLSADTTSTRVNAVYDSTNQKVVAFTQNATTMQAAVGTVSGTSISFGTIVNFGSFRTLAGLPWQLAFDASQGKIVVAVANWPTNVQAFVATVSGTSISFGSPTTLLTGNAYGQAALWDVAYDASSQRVIAIAGVQGSSTNQAAYVATISGTSISFAAGVNYFNIDGSNFNYGAKISYDPTAQCLVFVSCRGTGIGSQNLYMNTARVSGSTITFYYGTTSNPVISGTPKGPNVSMAYDLSQSKTAVLTTLTSSGTAAENIFLTTTAVTSTNLTSENFIGFSSNVYSTGATATIQIVGNINDGQTSLTPGETYYVQSAGGIGLSPSSPSVIAGTAYTTSKIIIKG